MSGKSHLFFLGPRCFEGGKRNGVFGLAAIYWWRYLSPITVVRATDLDGWLVDSCLLE